MSSQNRVHKKAGKSSPFNIRTSELLLSQSMIRHRYLLYRRNREDYRNCRPAPAIFS